MLGSATPSVDAYFKAKQGEYTLLELTRRAKGQRSGKRIYRGYAGRIKKRKPFHLSATALKELIEDRLQKHQQIMLFLNRRGYAGFVSCRSCGYVVKCPHCDVSLSAHRGGKLVCHYCGYETKQS